ncbi:probable UDP-3-O-acylglucosamine N-acyltransferase 2, mitochondrial isoform X1, partial [Tanacetum coccineum]
MDNRRPRISSYSPSSRSSNPRTTYRPQRPKKTVKSIWVKKGSTVGSQAVLPQTITLILTDKENVHILSPKFKQAYLIYSLGNLKFDRFLTQACQYQICVNARLENVDDEREEREFLKWHKGGGMFHKSATIDPTASIDFGAVVHSESLVAGNVRVGSGTVVGPNVTIGQSTKIGYAHLSILKQLCSMLPMYLTIQVNTCDMWYNVALANCTIGDSCVIHNGVCIGQDGKINWTLALNFYKLMEKEVSHDNFVDDFQSFGFYLDDRGAMVKKPQVSKSPFISYDTALKAHIGDNVEIGANSCIDRGRISDYVTLGGRVGVRDHVTIASKDITKPGDYGGFPAVPIREWRRQVASRSQTVNGEG